MSSSVEDSWHLSKSVPITLIFGLLVQAGTSFPTTNVGQYYNPTIYVSP